MNPIILLYYKDEKLNDYFEKCAAYIKGYLKENYPDAEIVEINDQKCNPVYVEEKLSEINGREFLFASYCHGSRDSCNDPQGNPFIKVNENDHMLRDGLVFTNSCHSGAELGPALMEKGAFFFVGFDDIVSIYPDYTETFAACDNFPFLLYLMEDFTKNEKVEVERKIKNFYDQQIDKLLKKDVWAAKMLMTNRDSLVLYFSQEDKL